MEEFYSKVDRNLGDSHVKKICEHLLNFSEDSKTSWDKLKKLHTETQKVFLESDIPQRKLTPLPKSKKSV
ncbi:unnamed protein product [Caenorhabditis angaria]|uniref:Uncharacterized protein n=1 Tax=Caenorhabditis angaria TaxID=860376 RepID=A0A9P1ICR3_9PELO|nr:unnamed protein product [Caenorhabditis angaria]